MANTIVVGPNYFEDFTAGQGLGASNYFTYAEDMDTNFGTIRTTINSLVEESIAVNGPNAVLGKDMVTIDDAALWTVRINNKIGTSSYFCVVAASNIQVNPGTAIVAGIRVVSGFQVNLTSSGGAGTRWIALDGNGQPTMQTSAGQKLFDVASATWNGSIFTAVDNFSQYAFDGDEYDRQRNEASGGISLPQKMFDAASWRTDSIARLVSGFDTNGGFGDALGPIVGSYGNIASQPGLTCGPGNGTISTGLGFFRSFTDVMSMAVTSTERFRMSNLGIEMQQGSATTPSYVFINDFNTGLYNAVDGQVGISGNGAIAATIGTLGIRNLNGVAGTPGYSFTDDPDTGMYRETTDTLSFATGAAKALGIDENGYIDSPTQARCRITAANDGIANDTLEEVIFDTSVTDIGDMWVVGTPTDFTVPTAGGGWYQIDASVYFDEWTSAGPGSGLRRSAGFRLNGTLILGHPDMQVRPVATIAADEGTALSISTGLQLAAGDDISLEVLQDSGSAMDVDAALSMVKLW